MITSKWITYSDEEFPKSGFDAFDIYWEKTREAWESVGLKEVDVKSIWRNGVQWRDRVEYIGLRTKDRVKRMRFLMRKKRVKEWLRNFLNKIFGRG